MCSGIEEDDNCFSKKYIENFCIEGKRVVITCERGDLRFDSANDVHSPIQIRLYSA